MSDGNGCNFFCHPGGSGFPLANLDALSLLFQLLTQTRPKDPPRLALHLSLQEAAAYSGLPAPFLLRLVTQRKLACWKTQGRSESGEGYFFARADLEALRAAVKATSHRYFLCRLVSGMLSTPGEPQKRKSSQFALQLTEATDARKPSVRPWDLGDR
jgi:hypothetical protein